MKTKIRLQISRLLNERFKLNTDNLEEKFIVLKKVWEDKEEKIIEELEKITGFSLNILVLRNTD